jgi:hypothetical protein
MGSMNSIRLRCPLLATCFLLVVCSAYPSTLKLEAVLPFETLVNFYQSTWCYTPEGSPLHSHRCDNLKSNNSFLIQLVY